MSWMDCLTSEQRKHLHDVNANLSSVRISRPGTKYLRYENGEVVEKKRLSSVVPHSMFPYKSTSMAVDPDDVEQVQEQLRKHGVFAEFDAEGRPVITSTKQHAALAEAMGMKTGRDGYGHTDENGKFQNSGRRRNDEIQEGRSRVRRARRELQAMPEDASEHTIQSVLDTYDIRPTSENSD